jgi:hypothetical protein
METDGYTDFDALKDMAMKLEVRVGGLLVGLACSMDDARLDLHHRR